VDFFEHQEVARKNTTRLIVLFAVAVAAIAFLIYGLVLFIAAVKLHMPFDSWWQPRIFVPCLFGTLFMIGGGSLWKIHQIGKGGAFIAERVGGRRVDPASTDPYERRILNVVEEMAVASGTPVPPVYVLDHERGINAFAAGRTVNDAVIGVTAGATQVLDRDELQGMIAHEFSHILNGDMWLNLELIGIVHGIELIGLVGRMLIRTTPRSGRRRGKHNGVAIGLGLALMAIGGIGSVCGRLIRLGVSRQREYLADAAAVQFTRNPEGVAGALKKIGGYGPGSHLGHPGRAEMSHMFFGSGLPPWDLSFIFSTHPALNDRIKRIDPRFDGVYPKLPVQFVARWPNEGSELETHAGAASMAEDIAMMAAGVAHGAAHSAPVAVAALQAARAYRPLIERLGDPNADHLRLSQAALASISDELKAAAHDANDARLLAYALMFSDNAPAHAGQEAVLRSAEGHFVERVLAFRAQVKREGPPRVALCELIAATLKGMERERFELFRRIVMKLAMADGCFDLAEWALAGLLLHQLDQHFANEPPPRGRYNRLNGLEAELAFVLSALAHAVKAGGQDAERAFEAAAKEVGLDGLVLQPLDRCTPRALEGSLATLSQIAAPLKKTVLAACAASIASDKNVSELESELFYVVAGWLDIPAPPLLPGQALA
jgi:Zn-dependent protease with chaperone function